MVYKCWLLSGYLHHSIVSQKLESFVYILAVHLHIIFVTEVQVFENADVVLFV